MDWIDAFPGLSELEQNAREKLMRSATVLEVPQGTTVFHVGDACQNYLFVISGSVRVQKLAENGREIVLYRVGDGDTCILTTSCLLGGEGYSAEGITESTVQAVSIPATIFSQLLEVSPEFRDFVFSTFARRMADLMTLIEEVVFQKIDVRLAKFLLEHCGDDGGLTITHQELAVELGSAREVISRQLKDFERHHWVSLGRGHINVSDISKLQDFSESGVV